MTVRVMASGTELERLQQKMLAMSNKKVLRRNCCYLFFFFLLHLFASLLSAAKDYDNYYLMSQHRKVGRPSVPFRMVVWT